jgi:6-pyruvoyl-tetrahydropterin synthase
MTEPSLTPRAEAVEAKLWIDSVISSAHRLPHVAETHRCHNTHGHDFRVRLHASGYVTPASISATGSIREQIGMVVDYDRILSTWSPLQEQLDHRDLNEVLDNPTCENLAIWILKRTPRWICAVEISTLLPSGAQAGCYVPRSRERGDGYTGFNVASTVAQALPADEVL